MRHTYDDDIMTVRKKAELNRILGSGTSIKTLVARSNCRGELQVQVIDETGHAQSVFIPPDRSVNLLKYGTPLQWKKSASLLSAVRLGHLTVQVDKETV